MIIIGNHLRVRALLERQIIYMTVNTGSRGGEGATRRNRNAKGTYSTPSRTTGQEKPGETKETTQTQRDKLELCSSVKLGNGINDSGAVTTALALARGKENGTKEPHPTAHFHPTDRSKKLTSASIISPRDPSHNRKTDANRTTPHAQRARVQG